MKPRTRLVLEHLEGRCCPALTASLTGNTLSIVGFADNGSINIVQDTTTAGTIQVLDGATPVTGSPFAGVNNLRIKLTEADDNVTIDLGGQTLAGNIGAHLGNGVNQFAVTNGGVGGRVELHAGNGVDTVKFGDGTAALALQSVEVTLNRGDNTFVLAGNVTVGAS